MKNMKTRGILSIISVVICAVAIFCTIIIPKTVKVANAGTADTVKVSEIWDDGAFNNDNLKVLYKYLTGVSGAEISDVQGLFTDNATLTAAQINQNVKKITGTANDIIVGLGGYEWTVVYMSQVDRQDNGGGSGFEDGDIIATLWLADTDKLSSNSKPVNWSGYSSNVAASSSDTYPINMYGTSNVRTKVLNNGGMLGTDRTTAVEVEKDKSSEWAAFTMTQNELDAAGSALTSIADFIVTPSQVGYQETEIKSDCTSGYRYPNECYGEISDSWYHGAFSTYPQKQGYNDWQYDYLWLPSLSELGTRLGTVGIWETSANQRAATGYGSWMRTGDTSGGSPCGVYYLSSSGTGCSTVSSLTDGCAARPALHLNLSAVDNAGGKKPVVDVDILNYTGEGQEFRIKGINNKRMDVTVSAGLEDNGDGTFTATEVGEYKVTVKLKDEVLADGFTWSDGTTDPVTLTLVMNKGKPVVEPLVDVIEALYPGGEFPDIEISMDSTPGTINWDDNQSLAAGDRDYKWTFVPDDTARWENATGKYTLTVVKAKLASMTATLNLPADVTVFTSTDINTLKKYLTVSGEYEDGKQVAKVTGYYLEGTLAAGTSTVYVCYKVDEDTVIRTEFEVEVTSADLDSIKAVFKQTGKVTPETALSKLKQWLTVTAYTSDGKSAGEVTNYTLTGELKAPSAVITVEYGGKSTTFNVNVTGPEAENVIALPDLSGIYYTGNEINVISRIGSLGGYTAAELLEVAGDSAGITAGTYNVILTFKVDGFIWDGGSVSLMKYGFASKRVAADISADGKSATLAWTINPAVIKGVWGKNGKLTLTSDSYKGGYEDVIGYYYYDTDGNEVLEIVKGRSYTVKAKLLDETNFVFDETTRELLASPEPHEFKAVSEKSGINRAFDKAKDIITTKFVGLPVWVWLLIALAVLLFLIIIIAIAAKRRKNKEAREEKKAAKQAAKEEAQAKAEAEKERREAEKQRLQEQREAEKQRLQEQREAEKARLESQREIEKMRTEAEIAKIKAQAQQPVIPRELATLTPNGVNDSRGIPPTPAPQYQPMPQAMPQASMPPAQPPFPQQAMPPQLQGNNDLSDLKAELRELRMQQMLQSNKGEATAQPQSNGELSDLKAELRELRMQQMLQNNKGEATAQPQSSGELSDLKAELRELRMQQMLQSNKGEATAQPQYVPPQLPAFPQQATFPQPQSSGEISELKAEIREMRNQQMNATLMQAELAKMKAELQSGQAPRPAPAAVPQYIAQPVQSNGLSAETVVSLMAAMVRGMSGARHTPRPAASEQKVTQETAPAVQPAVYPQDAVVTTTTTVDTTKNKERESFFDIDGFYDKFEG